MCVYQGMMTAAAGFKRGTPRLKVNHAIPMSYICYGTVLRRCMVRKHSFASLNFNILQLPACKTINCFIKKI